MHKPQFYFFFFITVNNFLKQKESDKNTNASDFNC